MPAASGEPWRGAALSFRGDIVGFSNGYRAWVTAEVRTTAPTGDLATWKGNAGGTLTLRFRWQQVGGGAGQVPNFASVTARIPDGANIGTAWSMNGGSFPAQNTEVTRTFHFDTDPMNQTLGTLRSGLIELYLDFGSSGGLGPWNLDSRGGSAGTGADNLQWARGKLMGAQVLQSFTLSDVGLAGAEPPSFAALDSLFLQPICTSSSTENRTTTASMRRPSGVGGATERSQAAGPNTAATQSYSWTGTTGNQTSRVGEGIFAGSEAKDIFLVLTSSQWNGEERNVWAASGHPAGWEYVDDLTLRYVGRVTVDPRLLVEHHNQLDDNVFDLAKNNATKRRLNTQGMDLWAIVKNARGVGLNNINLTQTLTPALSGTAISASSTTATRGGQAGVSDKLSWTSQIPGGTWNKAVDVTLPSDIDDDAYLTGGADAYTLVARDPYVEAAAAGGDTTRPGTHYIRGQPFTFGGALIHKLTGGLVEADSGDANRKAIVGRFNPTLNAGLGGAEYLDAAFEWQPWNNAITAYHHQLTEFVAGARLYLAQVPGVYAAAWTGDYPIFVLPILYRSGWPYGLPVEAGVFAPHNKHTSAVSFPAFLNG
jgi:hypothetical protein